MKQIEMTTEETDQEEEENKLPLKRVELSLFKFNDVAIPHHLNLLRQHKANILKYREEGTGDGSSGGRVRREREGASRVASRLRALVGEVEELRRAVRPSDRPAFDAVTARALADTRDAISELAAVAVEKDEVAPDASCEASDLTVQLQLQVEPEAEAREREEALTALQEEVGALQGTWLALHEAARGQREPVARAAANVDLAADQTTMARAHLAGGERLRGAGAAAVGAALGALAAGPLGLLVGLKAGAAAALAGSLLGYAATRAARARPAILPATSTSTSNSKED